MFTYIDDHGVQNQVTPSDIRQYYGEFAKKQQANPRLSTSNEKKKFFFFHHIRGCTFEEFLVIVETL